MMLCLTLLLICYDPHSGSTIIIREPGESITLKCSSEGCPKNDGYIAMYLYHNFIEQKEVYFYSNYTNGKLMARQRYEGRIESNGAPMNHDITISNLTVDDSGVYTCVYKESANKGVNCKVYTVFVRGFAPRPSQEPQITTTVEERFLVMLLIICICVISILLIIIFILLIMQKVKQRSSCRRLSNSSPEESNDCVYEVMMKNNFYSVAALEQ
ncbi:V-set and immunoglobulin domain-containing protein 1-like isoform X3 [Oreochromis aureus]|uniref:V-set and immunoglobulin domain-containing protein 1-like isoform X3 n=1 Tax=Oreochromis aureus TaxID=47969 RepID=UPI0012BB5778|nr:V-set and immunoglobulin domain-containing protein 1-like isoform X3 [Oreochromis aureus]